MKKLLIALLVLVLAGNVAFAQAAKNKPVELVYTMTAVPTDAHAGAMRVFKEVVERVSAGNIKVKTYDSASLFKQEQEVSAVKSGQADMTATAAPWLTDGSPWISMFTAGYMFKSYEHMTKVLNGEIGKVVFERVAKEQGIRPLGAQYLGTRQLDMVKDVWIKTPEDLKGVKLRMPNSDSWLFLGRALGANPLPFHSPSSIWRYRPRRSMDRIIPFPATRTPSSMKSRNPSLSPTTSSTACGRL